MIEHKYVEKMKNIESFNFTNIFFQFATVIIHVNTLNVQIETLKIVFVMQRIGKKIVCICAFAKFLKVTFIYARLFNKATRVEIISKCDNLQIFVAPIKVSGPPN